MALALFLAYTTRGARIEEGLAFSRKEALKARARPEASRRLLFFYVTVGHLYACNQIQRPPEVNSSYRWPTSTHIAAVESMRRL